MEQVPTIQEVALVYFIVATVIMALSLITQLKESEEEKEERRLKRLGKGNLPTVIGWTLYVLSIMTAF